MEPTTQPENKPETKMIRVTNKPKVAAIATLVIALIVIVVLVVFARKNPYMPDPSGASTPKANSSFTPSKTDSVPIADATPDYSNLPMSDDGVTWLGAPQKIDDLGLLTTPSPSPLPSLAPGETTPTTQYTVSSSYKIGTDAGHDIYVIPVVVNDGTPGSPFTIPYYFIKKDDSHYDYLSSINSSLSDSTDIYGGMIPSAKVSGKNTKRYNTLIYRKTIKVNNATLLDPYDYLKEWQPTPYTSSTTPNGHKSTAEKIASLPIGTVYRETFAGTDFNTMDYILQGVDGSIRSYSPSLNFIKDDYVPQVTWNDGTKLVDAYRTDGGASGCGGAIGSAALDSSVSSRLITNGKTSTGETVYDFKSADDPLVKSYYETYKSALANEKKYADPKYPPTGAEKTLAESNLSLADYYKAHGIFVYKDQLGDYLLFTNTTYGIQAECGKPVIYLYPTHTQKVSVSVDAKITKSAPIYNNGWNVTAQPDGTLTNTDGKTYDSLFWEGTGKEYPTITSGFVVKQADLPSTIKSQLEQLGLNDKEAADFMAFWLPKLPATPYVRLTWFGTSQMNKLAPLHISPAPDTLIRVFLDFEGLQQPISLPTEHLTALPRNGFTAVEWGGLLK